MARMWMVRGEDGRLYERFRDRGVVAMGWNGLATHAKPGVSRKQLAALYRSAKSQAKPGAVIAGASQVWRFVNEIETGDRVVTYSPLRRSWFICQYRRIQQRRPI